MIGTTLAHYRITAALGAGGMGEVWRAEEKKLDREVALKVLHPDVAQGRRGSHGSIRARGEGAGESESPEYRAPVWAGVHRIRNGNGHGHGCGCGRGTRTSRSQDLKTCDLPRHGARRGRGSLRTDLARTGSSAEAVPIALQIAQALEAAHEQGIVHRDLEPANIKLRADGTVKVLDFGLAKAWEANSTDASLSLSPTMTQHNTAAGLILGTAAYMSPEQARGQSVDRRSDIWAFGVVVWEMLTGRKLFEGDTVSDVLASVLKEAPSLDALPPETPSFLKKLVGRCLDKDSKTRLRDIGEARIALANPDEDVAAADGSPDSFASSPWRSRLPWLAAAVATVAALALGGLWVGRNEPEPQVIRFETPPPEDGRFHLSPDNPGPVAVAPDGSMMVYSGRTADGIIRLWVRALDEAEARVLPGTENAQYPFWSPDSRRIGFFSNGKLRVIEAVGGPPLALCSASDGKGGAWNRDGVIVFAPSYNSPLHQVAEAGGEPVAITVFDAERKDNSHRHPRFLPDGKRFLYMARSASGSGEGHAVMVGALDGTVDRLLFRAPTAVEVASGHLLLRPRSDPHGARVRHRRARVHRRPVPHRRDGCSAALGRGRRGLLRVAERCSRFPGRRRQRRELPNRVARSRGQRARGGRRTGELRRGPPHPRRRARGRVARRSGRGTGDVWVVDLRRDLFSRFTFEPGYEYGLTRPRTAGRCTSPPRGAGPTPS